MPIDKEGCMYILLMSHVVPWSSNRYGSPVVSHMEYDLDTLLAFPLRVLPRMRVPYLPSMFTAEVTWFIVRRIILIEIILHLLIVSSEIHIPFDAGHWLLLPDSSTLEEVKTESLLN